jgi:hypothetical protein
MMIYNKDLIRLEYKIDLLIAALQEAGVMLKDLPSLQGMTEDVCPVCKVPVTLTISTEDESVQRSCGCSLPITAVKGLSTIIEEGSHARKPTKTTSQIPSNIEKVGNSNS